MGVFARPDSPYWWIFLETTKQKERTLFKIGTTHAQKRDSRKLAEDRYHQRMNDVAARIYKLPSAQPAIRFDKYADSYEPVISQHRGASRERELLKHLRAFFGESLLTLIDREQVHAYRAHRRATVSARTVNREIDLLKSMLRDAAPKYLSTSPLVGLKALPVVPPKRRLLTPDEERRILRHMGPEDRAIFLIGLDGLVRLGDILDLRWEDDRGRTLYIRDPKDPRQSTAYAVPVSTRVRAALDALPTSGPYLFPKRRTQTGSRAVRMALQRACQKAGVPYGRKQNGVTFHWATRRTGATRMLQRGADIKAVQAVGHWKRPDVMLDIYAETTATNARRAVELVGPRRKSG